MALVITELDIGGAERALVALATGLDRRRWAPSVVALGPEAPLAVPLRSAGIPVQCLDVNARRPDLALIRLARALRSIRPALVQSFLVHANIAARFAGPLAGSPWIIGGIRVAERQKGWHLTVDRLTSWLGTGSVCVSEGVRQFSIETGRLNSDRLIVIPNGIDPAPIDKAPTADRSRLGIPPDAILALFVGRLHEQKDLPTLLDAASRVMAERSDWHLAIVGDGPERSTLVRLVDSLAIPSDRLHWLGRRDDVPALLKASDLLVLSSRWEGMPNVVLEAMAARRAVVSTRVEGTDDLIEPGQTGWLVPPQDPSAMAAALRWASAHPDQLRRFGEAGRTRVEREFSPGGVVLAYDALWSTVLGFGPSGQEVGE